MKTIIYAALVLASLAKLPVAGAQTRTSFKDLSDRSHVPLYDCSIFYEGRDRSKCDDIKNGNSFRFEDGGYAISCYNLSRSRQNACLRLATDLYYNAEQLLDCRHLRYDLTAQKQCEITRNAYSDGRFTDRGQGNNYSTTTTTTTVVSDRPVYTSTTTCDESRYDRAVENWRIRKEAQRKKGQTRATVGVVATIGGILLGTSNNRTVRTLGDGLMIGGVFLTAWGLVEMIDADSYPHLDPYCKTSWERETRMVVVEEQQCETTKYYERNRSSSRYYYEVTCSNKRYVTFEEFSPWNESRVTYYNY